MLPLLPGGRLLSGRGKAFLLLGLLGGGPALLLLAVLSSRPARARLLGLFAREAPAKARTFPSARAEGSSEAAASGAPARAAPGSASDPAAGAEPGSRLTRFIGRSPARESEADAVAPPRGPRALPIDPDDEGGPLSATPAEAEARAKKIAADALSRVSRAPGVARRRGLSQDAFSSRRPAAAWRPNAPGASGLQGTAEARAEGAEAGGAPYRRGLREEEGAAPPSGLLPGGMRSVQNASRRSPSGSEDPSRGGAGYSAGEGGDAPAGKAGKPGSALEGLQDRLGSVKEAEELIAEAQGAADSARHCQAAADKNSPAIEKLGREQGELSRSYSERCRSGIVDCQGHFPAGFDCSSMDPDECSRWSTCRRPKPGGEGEMEEYPCCVAYRWDFLGCRHDWEGHRRLNAGCWNRQKGYVCPCSALRCGMRQKCRGIHERQCEISKGCGRVCSRGECD